MISNEKMLYTTMNEFYTAIIFPFMTHIYRENSHDAFLQLPADAW